MDYESSDGDWQLTQTLSLLYTRNALVVSMTIIMLEYFQLLALERKFIWSSKWRLSKVLFLASRYLPLVFVTIWVYYNSAPASTSVDACRMLFDVATVLLIIACLCADAVLYLRLYALSKQSKLMMFVLIANYSVVAVICLGGISLFLRTQKFVPSPNLLPLTTCFNLSTKATALWAAVCYGALLYSSLFTTSLSLWYGIKLYLSLRPMPPSTLIKIFHRDGAFYFVCIATISLGNAFIALSAPSQYRYLLSVAQGMVHSVLAARMILHLRAITQETIVQSTIPTRSPVPRNAWGSLSTAAQISDFKARTHELH
ncbi:hypothetical protein BKA70DRAFT_1332487 [Coprinopsis sp. MPI-PUGE-AT-0042]|nr:hypothetical protein BKA70DRAFT_1332487 [Coprinopsis sp. MPI-PUGE-AT-0042]